MGKEQIKQKIPYTPIWEQSVGWHLRTLLVVFCCAVIVLLFRFGIVPAGYMSPRTGIMYPFSDAFIILGAGLCGYQYGIFMFLMILFGEYFDPNVTTFVSLFPLFLYLALALAAGALSRNRMFKNDRRTLLSFLLLEVLLCGVFYLIFVVLMRASDLALWQTFVGTIPECAFAVGVLYFYFRFAPEKCLLAFGAGVFYAERFDLTSEQKVRDRQKAISNRITLLSLLEGILLSVLAVIMTRSVLSVLETATLPEELQGTHANVIMFLLALTITFSVVLVVNEVILSIVTSVARKQQKLETELLVAEARSDAKSDFLSNMSHEIRTPINAVIGMNEMILRESENEDILTYAESARTAGNTLLSLVNDILDFSKIEAGKMEIIPVDYRLSSILNDLSNMLKTRADEKGLIFTVKVNPQIPDLLHGDEIRIKQIVTNILTNAVKYTKEGSVTLSVDMEHTAENEIELIIAVSDTGIGIKPENIEKLFTEFERIEEEKNRTIEGTGLGMNITKKLLDLMDGKLTVESVYGEGSTFTVRLKQTVVKNEPIGDYEEAFRKSVSKRKKYRATFSAPDARVLVVDDTPLNLVVFENLLKKTRLPIDTAESGRAALRLTESTKYDIIFLDHLMPDMSGIETLREIRKQEGGANRDTPTVCLTANAVSGAREEYLAAGFTDYLTKPIDAERLEAMICALLPNEKVLSPGEDENYSLWDDLTDDQLEIMPIYLDAISENAEMIEGYFVMEDWENFTIKVHALKSSSRMVGQTELGDLAERVEKAGKAGDIEFIRENTGELLKQYRDIWRAYRKT